jgi:poly-D-alanine transfer protein DltD
MRKLLAGFGAVILLLLPLGRLQAVPFPTREMKELKKRQKVERRMLRQQQHAMKKVMAQHGQSSDSNARFKHNLKIQQQVLQRSQKDATRRLKRNHNSVKRPIH